MAPTNHQEEIMSSEHNRKKDALAKLRNSPPSQGRDTKLPTELTHHFLIGGILNGRAARFAACYGHHGRSHEKEGLGTKLHCFDGSFGGGRQRRMEGCLGTLTFVDAFRKASAKPTAVLALLLLLQKRRKSCLSSLLTSAVFNDFARCLTL